MPDKLYNKIVFGNETLIDLTSDTVVADKILSGYTAHDKSGAIITGSCTYDSDTSDANAAVAEILVNKTAYARGSKLTGTMPNNGGASGAITTKAQEYSIAQGYHDGSGKVSISTTEQAKIIAGNIKDGVQILGVTGTYTGEGVTAQARTATPSRIQQTILPEENFDYLSQVIVEAIPYTEVLNSAGGYTATIG